MGYEVVAGVWGFLWGVVKYRVHGGRWWVEFGVEVEGGEMWGTRLWSGVWGSYVVW